MMLKYYKSQQIHIFVSWKSLVSIRRLYLRLVEALLLCIVSISIVSCGNVDTSQVSSSGSTGPLLISFSSSLTYEHALQLMTNLGLQLGLECAIGFSVMTPGNSTIRPKWQPVGQRDFFEKNHSFLIVPASAPSNWYKQLVAMPDVHIQGTPTLANCSSVVYGTPPSNVAVPISGDHAGIYARITFKYPITTYDDALYPVSNIGLHLADPCYDQSKISWHPMGQGHLFVTSHTLVVATNGITSSLWQKQLLGIAGVVNIKTPYSAKC